MRNIKENSLSLVVLLLDDLRHEKTFRLALRRAGAQHHDVAHPGEALLVVGLVAGGLSGPFRGPWMGR